jgi:pseudouridine-5'-phosphate glycosidase
VSGPPQWLEVAGEVAEALAAGRGVVALESSLIAHGLPAPHNLETALAAEAAIRGAGAIPATVAIDHGRVIVGAPHHLLERLADPGCAAVKAASRDIGVLLARRELGATTVSATLRAAHAAGIALCATGGIGGVHRDAASSHDVSSDIDELAVAPVAVVCSGAKAILDLPATLELLETRRVPLVGYGTDELPAFTVASAGLRLSYRVDTPDEAAALIAAHRALPGAGAILIAQPVPPELAIGAEEMERWIADALDEARTAGVAGGSVTPVILGSIARASAGRSLHANIGLVVNNARTAGAIATALAARPSLT